MTNDKLKNPNKSKNAKSLINRLYFLISHWDLKDLLVVLGFGHWDFKLSERPTSYVFKEEWRRKWIKKNH
jgi:hypothetical protein